MAANPSTATTAAATTSVAAGTTGVTAGPGTLGASTSGADQQTRGLPYYEKLRRDLRDTIQRKRLLDKNMVWFVLVNGPLSERWGGRFSRRTPG